MVGLPSRSRIGRLTPTCSRLISVLSSQPSSSWRARPQGRSFERILTAGSANSMAVFDTERTETCCNALLSDGSLWTEPWSSATPPGTPDMHSAVVSRTTCSASGLIRPNPCREAGTFGCLPGGESDRYDSAGASEPSRGDWRPETAVGTCRHPGRCDRTGNCASALAGRHRMSISSCRLTIISCNWSSHCRAKPLVGEPAVHLEG